jgi:hypothetical protein
MAPAGSGRAVGVQRQEANKIPLFHAIVFLILSSSLFFLFYE